MLTKATTSERVRRFGFAWGLKNIQSMSIAQIMIETHSNAFSSISKRTLSAVAIPVVWILPHNLHLSHPTQSMMRVTFLKCDLNSSLSTWSMNMS